MTKLLHTADVHLDSPLKTLALRNDNLRAVVENATRTAFERLIDLAIEEQVTALLIAGDLYDGSHRSMKTAAFLVSMFRRLEAAGIRVFIIRGNHDAISTITREIGWPGNVHVFDGRGGHVMLTDQIAVHGVSFREPHAPDSLVPRFRAVEGAVNIALLHTSLGGAAEHAPYAPCSVSDLAAAGFDYWALGHIHKRQVHRETPLVVMPGMPQGRDMGEGGPKSATLVHVGETGLRIEERPTAALLFERRVCEVSDCTDIGDVHARLSAAIRTSAHTTPTVLRVVLTGETSLTWLLRRDADLLSAVAEEIAQATGTVWIDRVEVATTPPLDTAPSDTAMGDIAALIRNAALPPGLPAEAVRIIEVVLSDLPPELRGTFGEDEIALEQNARLMISEAADWAIAAMHGQQGS